MTVKKDLKKRIRERMDRTGEPYMVARKRVLAASSGRENGASETPTALAGPWVGNFLVDALNKRAPSCTAALYSASPRGVSSHAEQIGTGTFIEHRGQLLLLTCAHVAHAFLRGDQAVLIAGESPRMVVVPRGDVRLLHAHDDDDVALLEVRCHDAVISPRSLAEFEAIEDFRKWDPSKFAFALVGFPAQRVEVRTGYAYRRINAMAYGTIDRPDHKPTTDRFFLEYRDNESDGLFLPHPGGLSGAAVIAWPKISGDRVWAGGLVVALQEAAVPGEYLKVTSIRRLSDWLD